MPQEKLLLKAPAKINLSLKVLGRREDGYHLLETHMHKVGLYDELELCPAKEGIVLHCEGSALPEDAANLVYRAADLFLRTTKEQRRGRWNGAVLSLKKNIPVAAGLGGGSSDAAATLLGLNQLLSGGCSSAQLASMGLQLGADVAFFLSPHPAVLATGIGEVLQPVAALDNCRILLVNPGYSVSTRWVYQNFALTESGDPGILANSQEGEAPMNGGQSTMPLVNDLERVTLKKNPELSRLKVEMRERGAMGALMSGSGPTVFGLFTDQQQALAAYVYFQRQFARTFLVDPEKAG